MALAETETRASYPGSSEYTVFYLISLRPELRVYDERSSSVPEKGHLDDGLGGLLHVFRQRCPQASEGALSQLGGSRF